MASIFTKIIQGELPCYKLFEDDLIISILTLEPIQLGHSLVIPKEEINHWYKVPDQLLAHIQMEAKKVAEALQQATGCPRVLTAAIGFEVPHYHLHLIPAWGPGDLVFSKAAKRSSEEMQSIHKKILSHLRQ